VEQFQYLEQPYQIKILFRKKLRGDSSQGMPATFGAEPFVLQFANNIKIKI